MTSIIIFTSSFYFFQFTIVFSGKQTWREQSVRHARQETFFQKKRENCVFTQIWGCAAVWVKGCLTDDKTDDKPAEI
ncbi:hypothetical protein [Anaerotruncus colihominis]